MKIRKTKVEDLERVMDIYEQARAFMKETGNPNQWGPTNWPPRALIEQDIAQGKSYVCEVDGSVEAVFFCDYGSNIEPTYEAIDGTWMGDDTYAVIHRIASSHRLKGIGPFCIQEVLKQYGHVRIDTHGDNRVMQRVLEKLGFVRCGIIHVVEDNDPRFAYEKVEGESA